MQLTKHFSLAELTITSSKLENKPNSMQFINLRTTAANMELVREILGNLPIVVTSAFRSLEINKAVGGARQSAHSQGLAVDFRCPSFGNTREVFEKLKSSNLVFDQLILEFPDESSSWIHIGWHQVKDRRQCLVAQRKGSRVVYAPA